MLKNTKTTTTTIKIYQYFDARIKSNLTIEKISQNFKRLQ